MKQNTRVGAILSSKNGIVNFLGYGVYVGDEVPPNEGANSMTGMLGDAGIPNPKIVLDSGDVVWGCECWWGPEEEIRKTLEGASEVRNVKVADLRKPVGSDAAN